MPRAYDSGSPAFQYAREQERREAEARKKREQAEWLYWLESESED